MTLKKECKSKQTTAQQIGQQAEQFALDQLIKAGLTEVQRNFYCRCGEIDLIMRDNSTLVFVEVRFRKSAHFGSGAATVTLTKQRKLLKTAHFYLQRYRQLPNCRFDVIDVSYLAGGEARNFCVDWIKDAFISTE